MTSRAPPATGSPKVDKYNIRFTYVPEARRFAIPLGGAGRVFLGWLLRLISWALIAVTIFAILNGLVEVMMVSPTLQLMTAIVCFGLGLWLGRAGGRLIASSKAVHWHSAEKPEVLLLRAFQDDDIKEKGRLFFLSLAEYFEEEIARVIKQVTGYKSLLALQDPLTTSVPLGFVRTLANDREWKEAVKELSKQARMIVVIAGPSAGLEWELHHLRDSSMLRKTVVIFPMNNLKARWSSICAVRELDFFRLAWLVDYGTRALDCGFVSDEDRDEVLELIVSIGGVILTFDDPAPPTIWGQYGYDPADKLGPSGYALLLRRVLNSLRDPESIEIHDEVSPSFDFEFFKKRHEEETKAVDQGAVDENEQPGSSSQDAAVSDDEAPNMLSKNASGG